MAHALLAAHAVNDAAASDSSPGEIIFMGQSLPCWHRSPSDAVVCMGLALLSQEQLDWGCPNNARV